MVDGVVWWDIPPSTSVEIVIYHYLAHASKLVGVGGWTKGLVIAVTGGMIGHDPYHVLTVLQI